MTGHLLVCLRTWPFLCIWEGSLCRFGNNIFSWPTAVRSLWRERSSFNFKFNILDEYMFLMSHQSLDMLIRAASPSSDVLQKAAILSGFGRSFVCTEMRCGCLEVHKQFHHIHCAWTTLNASWFHSRDPINNAINANDRKQTMMLAFVAVTINITIRLISCLVGAPCRPAHPWRRLRPQSLTGDSAAVANRPRPLHSLLPWNQLPTRSKWAAARSLAN